MGILLWLGQAASIVCFAVEGNTYIQTYIRTDIYIHQQQVALIFAGGASWENELTSWYDDVVSDR